MKKISRFLGQTAVLLLIITGCTSTQPQAAGQMVVGRVEEGDEIAVMATSPPRTTTLPPDLPTAVPTSNPTLVPTIIPPSFNNPQDDNLMATAVDTRAEFIRLTTANTGLWQFALGSFIHPIALAQWGETILILDSGRVLAVDQAQPDSPDVLLAPGMEVAGVRVLEPLDFDVAGNMLLVLDRAGDVYAYDLLSGNWQLERYDRPVGDTSGHYFVAVSGENAPATSDQPPATGRFLLEANYQYTMRFAEGENDLLWTLPDKHAVDVAAVGNDVYVLLRDRQEIAGQLLRYQDTRHLDSFQPQIMIERPRQVVAANETVLVLDQDGARLLAFDREDGRLQTVYQLPRNEPVSVVAMAPSGHLILAGQDRLYFYAQSDWVQHVPGNGDLVGRWLHDTAVLSTILDIAVPIGGSGLPQRDLQMPGAPRHYRLGIHQGVDFYWQTGTSVLAVADGIVIRANVDYVTPSQAQFNGWRAENQQLGYTSEAALDGYRGRQVWVQHDNGLVSRYIHLSQIAPGIAEGVAVAQRQLLGKVGNSGSPLSLESETADAHLHFELWLGDQYLGQFMRPIETRAWVERIFKTE